jgi:hypothetical protein
MRCAWHTVLSDWSVLGHRLYWPVHVSQPGMLCVPQVLSTAVCRSAKRQLHGNAVKAVCCKWHSFITSNI